MLPFFWRDAPSFFAEVSKNSSEWQKIFEIGGADVVYCV